MFFFQAAAVRLLLDSIVSIVAYCRLLKKSGEAWGKLFIPVYGAYKIFQMADDGDIFTSSLIIYLVYALSVAVSGTFTVFTLIIAAAAMLVRVQFSLDLARSFGKNGGFAVGLIFLPAVFAYILAFGDAKHFRMIEKAEKPESIAAT